MRLILTIIITVAIVFVVFFYAFPDLGNMIGNAVKKIEPEKTEKSVAFIASSTYNDFSFNAVGNLSIDGKNVTLRTSIGTFEAAERIKLTDYQGLVSFEKARINLNGEFGGIAMGENRISTKGKTNDGLAFDSAELNAASDEIRVYIKGYIISKDETVAVDGTVMIEKFSGSIEVNSGGTSIQGFAKNVTLVKAIG